jgi:hypothetical protein
MIYEALPADESLSQGDIFDECPLFRLHVSEDGIDLAADPARWSARVIVLTQACDLAQAKSTKVLVGMIRSAQDLIAEGVLKGPAIRDQVRRGLIYGWYFLPAAAPPVPLPESIVDLRELHTVPRPILEHLMIAGKRLCRLVTPYREHLAQHFAVTYMRIGLPDPYETQP